MIELVVRDAVAEDATAMAECKRRSWQTAYHDLLPEDLLDELPLSPPPEAWVEAIKTGHPPLVALLDNEVVGLAWVGVARSGEGRGELPDSLGELYLIYTEAWVWGAGVGYALHEACVERLRALGHDEAVLWVLEGNGRAIGFYERQGWVDDRATMEQEAGGVTLHERRFRREL